MQESLEAAAVSIPTTETSMQHPVDGSTETEPVFSDTDENADIIISSSVDDFVYNEEMQVCFFNYDERFINLIKNLHIC